MSELVLEFQVIFGAIALLGAYLFGSLNTARIFVFLTRQKGILETGTGNAGANNVWRVYGRRYGGFIGALAGIIVMIADIGKGVLIIYIARDIFGFPEVLMFACGIMTMAGHSWPIWWKFRKGGKAIAILGGMLLMLHPLSALMTLSISLVLPFTKRLSGLVPFVPVSLYILTNLILQSAGLEKYDFGILHPLTIIVLFLALILVYLRRIDAEWLILEKQPSKRKALWYLLIYDRATNDPPSLLGKTN